MYESFCTEVEQGGIPLTMTTREPMRWQAFIAYADVDREWTRCLAENLYRIGLNIFYDGWELIPGDVFVTKIDEGLAGSRTGLLVVSPRSLAYPWVDEQYAAILTATVRRKGRLIPILLGEARLPPMLATRHAIDFTGLSGDRYEQRVRELANAILAHRPHRPHRGQPIQAPPPADGISVADNEASKIQLLASLRELRAAVVTSSQPQAEDSDIQSHLAQEAFVQSFGAVGRLYGVPGMAKKLTRGLLSVTKLVR